MPDCAGRSGAPICKDWWAIRRLEGAAARVGAAGVTLAVVRLVALTWAAYEGGRGAALTWAAGTDTPGGETPGTMAGAARTCVAAAAGPSNSLRAARNMQRRPYRESRHSCRCRRVADRATATCTCATAWRYNIDRMLFRFVNMIGKESVVRLNGRA